MPGLDVFEIGLPGGLQESREDPIAQGWDKLENIVIYRGRLALRAPLIDHDPLPDSGGGQVTEIIGMSQYKGKLVCACYDSVTDEVNLVSVDKDGTNATHEANIWTSVTTQPTAVIMEPITAGTASSPEERLYIADFDQTFATRYWNDSTMTTLTEDLDLSSSAEDVIFNYLKVYQFHLWGAGFFEGTTTRGEMLRYSTPGLIPLTDFASGNDVDWHVNDHVSVGRRGDIITGLEVVNGRLIVFQQEATHAITGYSRDSWTLEVVSPVIGAAGPFAFDHYAGRECYFWSSTGPMITDGTQVVDIGEAIREKVNSVNPSENIVCRVDAASLTAYFFVEIEGEKQWLAYNIQQQVWTEGAFLNDNGNKLDILCGARVSELGVVAAGPTAAPSSLTATLETSTSTDTIDLAWTNGDTAINVETEIYRDTSSPVTPGAGTLLDTVESGIDSYEDTGLDDETEYYYTLRHKRNNQFSSASNEDSAETALLAPTSVTLQSIVDGVEVDFNNPYSSSYNVRLQRRTSGGSYSALVLLTGNPDAISNYEDDTASCGTTYQYRARIEKSGSVTSAYTASAELEACSDLPSIENIQMTATVPDPVKPNLKNFTITWDWVNQGHNDRVWVKRDGAIQTKTLGDSYQEGILSCPVSDVTFVLEVHINNETTNIAQTETFNNVDRCSEGAA